MTAAPLRIYAANYFSTCSHLLYASALRAKVPYDLGCECYTSACVVFSVAGLHRCKRRNLRKLSARGEKRRRNGVRAMLRTTPGEVN